MPFTFLPPRVSVVLRFAVLLAFSALSVPSQAQQPAADFTVEVQVADQGAQERSIAYRLAFDRVLRRQVETRIRIEPAQRDDLMRDPSLYVQRFRYRGFVPGPDNILLATRSVQESSGPAAVLAVTFPNDLAAILQQQLIPVVEEAETPVIAPTIALIAVEQQGDQFIISGDRGRRFQERATQLAAANNLQLEFPLLAPEDLELISAADIFNSNAERINSFATRYVGNELLTGAIYRITPTIWQSDWTYTGQDQQVRTFGLSTATLDEALVAAMTQLSPDEGFLGAAYDDSGLDGSSTGLAIRVENVRSLADYDTILATLRRLDSGVITELLEPNAMVFRVTEQGAQLVRNSLLSNSRFEPVNTDQISGELSFRYLVP